MFRRPMFRLLGLLGALVLFSTNLHALTIDTTNRTEVNAAYGNFQNYKNVLTGWSGGNIASCTIGTTSTAHQQATIDAANFYRALTGLPSTNLITDTTIPGGSTIVYRARKAALYMAANQLLDHTPSGGNCYDADVLAGASTSNLALGWDTPTAYIKATGPGAIDGYISDDGNETTLGHRRWMLYTQQIGFATGEFINTTVPSYYSSNALRLWAADASESDSLFKDTYAPAAWVAWPSPNFVPYTLIPATDKPATPVGFWSLSYPGARFNVATVTMTKSDGSSVSFLTTPAELPLYYGDNTIIFEPNLPSFAAGMDDTSYKIVVSGITGAPSSTYCYTVTVFDPAQTIVSTAPDLCNPSAQSPNITAQSADANYTQGDTASPLTITANVTDGGTLSYQWYSNTTGDTSTGTLVGTNSNSYTPSTATVGTLYYYAVVTNTRNGVTNTAISGVMAVVVSAAPPTYGITLDQTGTYTFPSATIVYAAQTPLTVTITNIGTAATDGLTVTLTGSTTAFTRSPVTVATIAPSSTGSFTVTPATGLTAGTYNATVTVSNTAHGISASFDVTFTVLPANYSITLDQTGTVDLGSVTIPYTTQPALTVTITNTGTAPTGNLSVAMTGSTTAFSLSASTVASIAVNSTGSFTVRPNNGLSPGTYNATITVTGSNGISASFDITFTTANRVGTNIIDLSDTNPPPSGTGWTYSSLVYTIQDGADVIVINDSTNYRRLEVATDAKATITLNGMSISATSGATCALLLDAGSDVTLILADGTTNILTSSIRAGIQTTGATLTIDGQTAGTGSLTATGNGQGAGIGGYPANSTADAGDGGNIIINGGFITAIGSMTAAGIGGGGSVMAGNGGSGGNITINGGTVNASSTSNYGAGIGSGEARAVGSGVTGGYITITGGTVNATGGTNAAGIGGGAYADGGNVIISGGTVTAGGGGGGGSQGGAGIGSGGTQSSTVGASGNILIYGENTVVTATGGGTIAQGIGAGSGPSGLGATNAIFVAIPEGNLNNASGEIGNPVWFTADQPSTDVVTVTLPSPFDAAPFGNGTYDLMTGLDSTGKTFSVLTSFDATDNTPFALTGYDVSPDPATGADLLATGAHIVFTLKTYGISLSETGTHDFGSLYLGYSALTPLNVTVTNTGNQPTGALSVAMTGDTAAFALSTTSINSIARNGADAFTVVPNPGLAVGTYNATITVTGNNSISESFGVTFTVLQPIYSISLTPSGSHDFGSQAVGYSAQMPWNVTVANTGNQATGNLTIALSGATAGSFTLSKTTINSLAVSGSDTFTVVPNTGLAANSYSATVTVSNGANITASFGVSFTVTAIAQTPTLSSLPTGTITYTQNDTATPLTISANVTDGGTLTYQWYRNTTNSTSGGTPVCSGGASCTPDTTTAGTYYYYVVVTNTSVVNGTTSMATSNIATVVVNQTPGGDTIDLSLTNPPLTGRGWSYSGGANGVYTIHDAANVTVINSNAGSQRRLEVDADATATVTLNTMTITSLTSQQTALLLNAGADVHLVLAASSNNTLISGMGCAGIQTTGATLTISDAPDGILNVTGGDNSAGIGGWFNNGNGSDGGTIIINSGEVHAFGGNDYAAGIGGGYGGDGGNITINGGTVSATGNPNGYGAAGIGGGGYNAAGGNITITGGAVTAAGGLQGAAGIGGGFNGAGGNIVISGGTVIANGGNLGTGAGIGGGQGSGGASGNILIYGENTSVTANGNGGAQDIGAGYDVYTGSAPTDNVFVAIPEGNLKNASGNTGNSVLFTATPTSGGIVTMVLPSPFNAAPFGSGTYNVMTGLDTTGKTFSVITSFSAADNIAFALPGHIVNPDPSTGASLQASGATVVFSAPPGSPLTFTYNTAFDIPASTVGTAITPINVSGNAAGGTTPYTFSATGLPSGISISAAGVISGTPTTPTTCTPATCQATITVTDSETPSASQSITISYGTISAAPTYGISLSQTGTYDFGSVAAGYAPQTALPVTVTNTGNQPTGALSVTMTGSTGAFTLSPTTVASIATSGTGSFTVVPNTGLGVGAYNATVTVSNAANNISKNFGVSFEVTAAPIAPTITTAPGALAAGMVNVLYSVTLTSSDPAATWASSGTLPPGLTLDPTTGIISGTPTTAGTFNFNVTATDNGVTSAPVAFSILISPPGTPAPTITTTPGALPDGTLGSPYGGVTLTASDPVTWSVAPGTLLPPGLTLDPITGVISGTPTMAGTFNFSVTATNGGGSVSVAFNILISPPPGGGGGAAQSIPTLNPAMLMLLALVLAVAALRQMQRKRRV
ncbi:MAG: putative Ig domain-containing protein [Betaproteobacteria bacterium]|nr:putative Ig domain-containing protein [Betaproteobacteria bacterium]